MHVCNEVVKSHLWHCAIVDCGTVHRRSVAPSRVCDLTTSETDRKRCALKWTLFLLLQQGEWRVGVTRAGCGKGVGSWQVVVQVANGLVVMYWDQGPGLSQTYYAPTAYDMIMA